MAQLGAGQASRMTHEDGLGASLRHHAEDSNGSRSRAMTGLHFGPSCTGQLDLQPVLGSIRSCGELLLALRELQDLQTVDSSKTIVLQPFAFTEQLQTTGIDARAADHLICEAHNRQQGRWEGLHRGCYGHGRHEIAQHCV